MERHGSRRRYPGGNEALKKAVKKSEEKERRKIAEFRAKGGKPIFVRTIHIVPQTGQHFKETKEYYDLDMAKTIAAILRKDKWIKSCRVIRGEAA